MGAWAPDAFGNDTALDWVPAVAKARTWRPVEKALRVAVTDDPDAAEIALAAVEVIAAGVGFPSEDVPPDVPKFVHRAGVPQPELVALAQRRLDEVTSPESELRALWAGSPTGEAWIEAVDDLRRRLSGLPPRRREDVAAPLVPWATAAVQDWIADFYLGDDWTAAGGALIDARPVGLAPRGPVRFRGLAAVEAVCAALGRPTVELPSEVAEAVDRLGMPAMSVLDRACFVATRLAKRDASGLGGELPAAWVDLLSRLRGCDANAVRRDPEGWHPATGTHEARREILRGGRRRRPIVAGDVVALRYPRGWVVGRVVPARTSWRGGCWVWLYEGFRPAPDDLTEASFARRWAGPRIVDKGVFQSGWLELQDPSLRTYDDGAPELDHADPLPYGPHGRLPYADYPKYLHEVERAGQLDDEVRFRSGVGFRELVEAKVAHYVVHGVREQCPGEAMNPAYVWRNDFFFADRAPIERLARELRDAIPREHVDAMRRAWVARAEASSG